ncbi:KH domain-containing protein [Candidatus Hikarchaeum yamanae]|uniref:KH domain-containing protein n=1 Tax=Candidatus Hikarchaeum yamanae TaxID=2675326 RepID=UPI0039EAF4B0|tara:strand:+ start:68534 stop:69070 length:537 start_codon:yes stop_codon:yes gene_type:complete
MQYVKIPGERIGVLIGEGGATLQKIESHANVTIEVDSDNHRVQIENTEAPFEELAAADIVKAIGRGFSPKVALSLLKDDNITFDLIELKRLSRNENDMRRHKSRLIGKHGRTRATMEDLTDTKIVIYRSTVGIIGPYQQVDLVRSAIEMIIDGSRHGSVYGFLERKRQEANQSKFEQF